MTVLKIPIHTCPICKCQFARSRRVMVKGKPVIRFDYKSIYCSNKCRQKGYRINQILKRRSNVTQSASNVTIV